MASLLQSAVVGAHYSRLVVVQGFRPLVGGLAARCFAEKLIDMDSASSASANTQPEEDKTRALLAAVAANMHVSGVCKVGGAVETLHYVMRCKFLVGVYKLAS